MTVDLSGQDLFKKIVNCHSAEASGILAKVSAICKSLSNSANLKQGEGLKNLIY